MILVFGRTGQLANELQLFDDVVAVGREHADLINPAACAQAIFDYRPSAVINAAAYTAVDQAEESEPLATIVNGNSPAAMAQACAKLGVPMVHISTDYVFDGQGTKPWRPTDRVAPQNAYGRSKLIGEQAICDSGAIYVILRTSWVISAHGSNFVKTMLRLATTHHDLRIVSDQIGGPTPAHDLAAACISIASQLQKQPRKSGIFHFCGSPNVSWFELAAEIFKQSGKKVLPRSILTKEYPTPAKRPLNSRLDCSATKETFSISQPNWRVGLKYIFDQLEATR